jgi:hypothetical protein
MKCSLWKNGLNLFVTVGFLKKWKKKKKNGKKRTFLQSDCKLHNNGSFWGHIVTRQASFETPSLSAFILAIAAWSAASCDLFLHIGIRFVIQFRQK